LTSPHFSDNYEWRISEAQYNMICDRVRKLSKKEASLVIKLIQAVFDTRISELKKDENQNKL
jgi:hypothetical protein